jgi:alkylation response protein AidB-like acyl-CoA dehydrogenase
MDKNESLRDELLAEIAAVAPILTEQTPESEKLGCLSNATWESLRGCHLLGFLTPRELGGDEADPLTHLEVIEALARIDASISWVVGNLALNSAYAAAFLPARSAQRIFAERVPPMAGTNAPRGQAEVVLGGYRVNGRWAFGSGVRHAEWVIATTVVSGVTGVEGALVIVVPRAQVTIHDNWHAAGLKASSSCDYSLENVFVPDEMTFPFTNALLGKNLAGGEALRLGFPAVVAPFAMGIALGIARHALDEITAQAVEKGRGLPPSPLATHPHFQFALGKAELQLSAARALAFQVLSRIWDEACAGRMPPPEQQAKARAAAVYITELAQRVTTAAFQAAGGSALFNTHPLQRCFRDVYAAGQHFTVSQSAYRALGQFKLKQPDANPML